MNSMNKFSLAIATITLTAASAISATPVSAFSLVVDGSLTIDFSGLLGTQTLSTSNKKIDIPFTTDEILNSLSDGDSSIPIVPLFDTFLPQEIAVGVTVNSVTIETFSGSANFSSITGKSGTFDFEYAEVDPVLNEPVIEVKNFSNDLNDCVFNTCTFSSDPNQNALLSATFNANIFGLPMSLSVEDADVNFDVTITPEPDRAATPESKTESLTLLSILAFLGFGARYRNRKH
jgi:hypothetical protein